MNEKDFEQCVANRLEGLSLEKQIEELEKVQKLYLPGLILRKKQQLGSWVPAEEAKNYTLCRHCQKYYLKKDCEHQDVREIRIESVFTDCGYGDDDMIGEVEYLVRYGVCHRCGYRQEIDKFYMRTICEWKRIEGKSTAKYYNK